MEPFESDHCFDHFNFETERERAKNCWILYVYYVKDIIVSFSLGLKITFLIIVLSEK